MYDATVPGAEVETGILAQPGGRLRERLDDGQLAAVLAQQHYGARPAADGRSPWLAAGAA